jgi:WD40 repeat protein
MATRQPIGLPLVNGQAAGIDSMAFSPGGKTLATGNVDGTIWLWDVTTRKQIGGPFTGHGGSVTSVAFSPDGKTLASSSDDQTVRLWNVATPSQNLADATNLVRYLCALAGRSLTPSEWAQYVPNLEYQTVCP